MDSQREKAILALAESARMKSDAIIVVGILPGDRFFYSCDDRVPIADLHGILRRNLDRICAQVADGRQRKQQERTRA